MKIATALALIALAFSAQGQTPGNSTRLKNALRLFPQADANGDGVLTQAEAKEHLTANPELRKMRQEDGEGDGTVETAVLDLYEAREFEGVKYRLLKPIDLSENPGRKYPMILSLHGAAGTGNDNVRNLREWNTVMAQEELRRKHPCFVVVPQSAGPWRTPAMAAHYTDEKIAKMPEDWQEVVVSRRKLLQDPNGGNLDRVFLLLDALATEFPIDTDRVYVLGHSMGGFGSWTAVVEGPNRFAAAITSAGWLGPWIDANPIKEVPIWSFQGAKDKTSQVSMGISTFERMAALGAKVKFTEMANHGHNVNEAAFAYTGDTEANGGVTKYASDNCDKTADVWDWLFAQKRAAQ